MSKAHERSHLSSYHPGEEQSTSRSLAPDTPGDGRLADLGWSAEIAHAFAPYAGSHHLARVSRVERGGAEVITDEGQIQATYGGDILAAAAADRSWHPAVGDWVALRYWPDGRITIDAILPRHTAMVRDGADRTSHAQVVAANVDVVVIVEHLDPEPDLGRIERLLVLAWASGATPLVVLTKADLVPAPEVLRDDVAAVALGVDVLAVSAPDAEGLDDVRNWLGDNRTMTFVGPSGAGKSTLVNALAGAEVMPTGEVRASDGKGRHTTTHRELIMLPGGGVVIDTPGIRAVGLVANEDAIADAFPDIEELVEQCRFADCAHNTEPDCAVRAAVETGELDAGRLARWYKLGREAAYQARRADVRLRQQERAEWKRREKALRGYYRLRSGKGR
ncbi:ribosome small subunit-dependent GTPase A [Phytoactinopolyspora mesophila]|uniref:Small ribosomal subunit biogenesis GTPase RsgA n=1 Tax=Phytoactinopolyspora mesophila TaxID=2650750 RepID=A0A7K3LZL4_9ACTN|nr:ribosome small subunit-dependent GTPase A [Phytoactinopolyspora mesophila]NDL56247.1 ribosome small subunit-dependent GTPase A [Phytoactinopolyspora mesophila]